MKGKTVGTIETKRLLLRNWMIEDANDLYRYAQNPNVGPHGGWKPHESIEESREIIRTLFLETYFSWAIVLKEQNLVVGSIGYEEDLLRKGISCMELGYALGEDYWGKGLMTEAAKAVLAYGFQTLQLDLVSIYRNPQNTRSGRVIDKCGFTYEGTLRMANRIYTGEIRDVACFSMTRAEFQQQYEIDSLS